MAFARIMEFLVTEDDNLGIRLDRYLAGQLPECSRSRIQNLIKDGHILFNNRRAKPKQPVSPGDVIQVTLPEPAPANALPQEIPLEIFHEDQDLLVLNKPSGLVVHPGAGNPDGTLVNALLHHCDHLSGIGGILRPGIVHRLDKDTSGCMVVAANDASHRDLSAQFANREVSKKYLAVVEGSPRNDEGRLENQIARHPVNRMKMAVVHAPAGKTAVTEYRVRHKLGDASLIECNLLTGRTHQIRVHLKSLGTPILGDEIYAKPERQKIHAPRLLLHAWKLAFRHPSTGQHLSFTAPIPPQFNPFLDPAL